MCAQVVDLEEDVEVGGDRRRDSRQLDPTGLTLLAHPTSIIPREFKLPSVHRDGPEHRACWRTSPLKTIYGQGIASQEPPRKGRAVFPKAEGCKT